MEHISDALFSYITIHGGQCNPPKYDRADLKRIAEDGDIQEMVKFMKLVFLGVAVCPMGPRKDECQQRMATLEESTMLGLSNIMADVPRWAMQSDSPRTESPRTQDEHRDHSPSPSASAIDSDLVHEAQTAQLKAENYQLKHELGSLRKVRQEDQNKYSRLQDNYEALKEELNKAQKTLHTSVLASKGDGNPTIKLLHTKIQEKDEIISDKDHETFELREQMQKNARDAKAERAKVQEFKDELDVIKSERDNFAKKANTLEKYRQKIQSSQQDTDQLRKEISQLRKENDAASDALKHHSDAIEGLRKENTKLELEHNEYRPALSRSEQHNHDLQKAKKRLEFDNTELAQRLHACEQREQALLRELGEDRRESVADESSGVTPDPNLLTELGGDTEGENQLRLATALLTWTRLISLSRKDQIPFPEGQSQETQPDLIAQVSALRSMLDDAEERQKIRDAKYLETYQEKLQLESSLKQVREGKPIEGSKSPDRRIENLTHKSSSTESFQKRFAELENEKRKRAEIETQLREAIRQLDTTQQDRMSLGELFWVVIEQHTNHLSVALVDLDKLRMLEEVKKQNSAALIQLQKQHKILQGHYKDMESDLDDHKVMLRKSIDDRAFRQTNNSSNELQDILQVIKAATTEQPTESAIQESISKRIDSLSEIIFKDREGVAKAREVNKLLLPEADYEFRSLLNPPAAQPPSRSSRPPSFRSMSATRRPPSTKSDTSWIGRFKPKDRKADSEFHP